MTDTTITSPRKRTAMRFIAAAGLAAVAGLAACTGGPVATQPAPQVADTAYELGAGDEVRIEVFGDESLSGKQTVNGEGALSMPLIGRVEAAGRTAKQLKAALEESLSEYMRDPKVTVQVLTNRPFYIVGEVRDPGSYSYVDGMTVINAVALAGGYTYRASKGDFVIQRNKADALFSAQPNTPVRPGDVITVRERYF